MPDCFNRHLILKHIYASHSAYSLNQWNCNVPKAKSFIHTINLKMKQNFMIWWGFIWFDLVWLLPESSISNCKLVDQKAKKSDRFRLLHFSSQFCRIAECKRNVIYACSFSSHLIPISCQPTCICSCCCCCFPPPDSCCAPKWRYNTDVDNCPLFLPLESTMQQMVQMAQHTFTGKR